MGSFIDNLYGLRRCFHLQKHRCSIPDADVCLILEGTYPYVSGGVSSWAHQLISAQSDLRFTLLVIVPADLPRVTKYHVPDNVVHIEHVVLQQLPRGKKKPKGIDQCLREMEPFLDRLHQGGGYQELHQLLTLIQPRKKHLGAAALLDSNAAWRQLQRMYLRHQARTSFIDYFWSWRSLLESLYSVLLCRLPPAQVYHAVSTGYAGLVMARAVIEQRRPGLLTEHGIYTNERRIELALADWLYDLPYQDLTLDHHINQLKDMWVNSFVSYSRAAYQCAQKIITLYEGNQYFQQLDNAPANKLQIIPNGVDLTHFKLERHTRPQKTTVAMIGRVVPIKDIKTFLRAIRLVADTRSNIQAWVLGPYDEDPDYFEQCRQLQAFLGLENIVDFKGKVDLRHFLGQVDVVVLTSVSEAQPLVILEAGAVGIPTVATDVGACREMILGRSDETPHLGDGGMITPLAAPEKTAEALLRLLGENCWYQQCSAAIRTRVHRYYDKADLDQAYRKLYRQLIRSGSINPNTD